MLTESVRVFFTTKVWVYVMILFLVSTPVLPWTELTGRQVMRIDWSAPREVVNSSLGETSFNSDWGGGGGGMTVNYANSNRRRALQSSCKTVSWSQTLSSTTSWRGTNLCNEVVIEEDIGWSGQHGVG